MFFARCRTTRRRWRRRFLDGRRVHRHGPTAMITIGMPLRHQRSVVGLVVEFSPATRETRVRFPDYAILLLLVCLAIPTPPPWRRTIHEQETSMRSSAEDAHTAGWGRVSLTSDDTTSTIASCSSSSRHGATPTGARAARADEEQLVAGCSCRPRWTKRSLRRFRGCTVMAAWPEEGRQAATIPPVRLQSTVHHKYKVQYE